MVSDVVHGIVVKLLASFFGLITNKHTASGHLGFPKQVTDAVQIGYQTTLSSETRL